MNPINVALGNCISLRCNLPDCAVTFVNQHKNFAECVCACCSYFSYVRLEVFNSLPAKFMDKWKKPGVGCPNLFSRSRPLWRGQFHRHLQRPFDLFIKFVTVGDDHDARFRIIFQIPWQAAPLRLICRYLSVPIIPPSLFLIFCWAALIPKYCTPSAVF